MTGPHRIDSTMRIIAALASGLVSDANLRRWMADLGIGNRCGEGEDAGRPYATTVGRPSGMEAVGHREGQR